MSESKPKPILLALSTFRQSDAAVNLAIEKAKPNRDLVIVYVVDVNLARYLIGVDIAPQIKQKCEADLLADHKEQGRKNLEAIEQLARQQGLQTRSYLTVGRFALECLPLIAKENPELVVTTRSKRPAWVKRMFGSPVDYLIAHAGRPVIEA